MLYETKICLGCGNVTIGYNKCIFCEKKELINLMDVFLDLYHKKETQLLKKFLNLIKTHYKINVSLPN